MLRMTEKLTKLYPPSQVCHPPTFGDLALSVVEKTQQMYTDWPQYLCLQLMRKTISEMKGKKKATGGV